MSIHMTIHATMHTSIHTSLHPSIHREDGGTALMLAARQGLVDILELLIKHDASVNAEDGLGLTALMLAARAGQSECLASLLRCGARVNKAHFSLWQSSSQNSKI